MNYRWVCLYIILCLLPLIPAFSQGIEGPAAQENLDKIGAIEADFGVVRKFDNRYEGVKGSPFYLDKWEKGIVEFESGRTAKNIQVKYNIYEDELLIQDPKTGAIYIDKNNVKSFTLQTQEHTHSDTFKKLPHPKKEDVFLYYRVVHHGDVNLLEQNKIIFEKANYEGGYSNNKTYDEFKKYTSYYFTNDTSPTPSKLKSSASGVAKIFPDHQNQVKGFINKNLLDCRKIEDLLKVFDYYDGLE